MAVFGLAGGKDAAYTNMAVQQNLSAAVMNLARLAVNDIIAQNNLIVRNNVSAGNAVDAGADIVGNTVNANETMQAGSTIDAGGSMTTGEDVQATNGTVQGNSVLATDDGRFASLFLDGTEIFLNSFPMPINGTFGYLQSLTDPASFTARYVQSYTQFVLNVDESLTFFINNVPAGDYILNFTLQDQNTPRAITYIVNGTSVYNPFSSRTNPFLYFTHPGGVLSVGFATEHGLSATIPVTSMILSQFVTPEVSPDLFTFSNPAPIPFVNAGLSTLDPANFTVVTNPQSGVTLTSDNTQGIELYLIVDTGPGTPSTILANAQYTQMFPMSVSVTRLSGGVGSFFATAFIVFGIVVGVTSVAVTTLSASVAVPDPNVPTTITLPLNQCHYVVPTGGDPTEIRVTVRVAFTNTVVNNYYDLADFGGTIPTVNTTFTVTAVSSAVQVVLFPN